ncbi:MAG: MbnH family di-heme enzyme [Gallionellaceae bacterium]|jgi:cytochrome c peroxidase
MTSILKNRVIVALGAMTITVLALIFLQFKSPSEQQEWQWNLPAHFPIPLVPADNPMSEDKFQLGRSLFYDKRLSGNGTMACASCHFQNLAFTDGKAVATGSTGEHTLRSAQGLANSVYHPYFTWANYALGSMERQMIVPLTGERPVEMGINDATQPLMQTRLEMDEYYAKQFQRLFPNEKNPIRVENIIKAISTFQRGMISANSKYDQSLMNNTPLSENEERGRKLFFSDQAQCSQCHGSFNFNDQVIAANIPEVKTPFHNTGLYNLDGNGAFPEGNRGIFEVSDDLKYMGAFRAPSLRNVAVTAPYMHDGSIATLEGVLDFYANHGRNIESGPFKGDGRASPLKDKRIDKISLSAQEKADIIVFLNTLTDHEFLSNPRFSNPFGEK